MNKIGLALSGGGFRASLYHLGLIRFLRDAHILPQVTHITSVSGGSIIAAHLVLNWNRYNGSSEEFDDVASEFLSFVDLDIRNRIVRRFPLNIPLRVGRQVLGLSNRKLTRTGLLESHYEKHLYGDTSLFELPEKPKLYILSTNLSEGCLCSFTRDGLLMVRRGPDNKVRIDPIQTGLATVAMAVASSSAFAGFFPPIELTGADVGVNEGEFGRQAYTDGGVFDNLGVRMFGCLEPRILAESPLSRDDFFDSRAAFNELAKSARSSEDTPLRRLAQILREALNRLGKCEHRDAGVSKGTTPPALGFDEIANEDRVLTGFWDVIKYHPFQAEPLFAGVTLLDPHAETLRHASQIDKVLDAGDQLRLNRHLIEAAFRQATGAPCFRRLNSALDGVLVSDVGKHLQVQSTTHAGGLIRTALRATDILMERVWELESEAFHGSAGFVFAPILRVVDPDEDPTALPPDIQRELPGIRTDLDRFSSLEISSLVRHGYCVGRKVCREHPDLFGADLPGSNPWDPMSNAPQATPTVPDASHRTEQPGEPSPAAAEAQPVRAATARHTWRTFLARKPSPTTVKARALQASATRRFWSTFLDRRDWVSYVYVPLMVPILTLLPYFVRQYYEWNYHTNLLLESVAQGSPALKVLNRLLRYGPDKPWVGVRPEPDGILEPLDFRGYQLLQLSQTTDLRRWKTDVDGQNDSVHRYVTLKVRKEVEDPPGGNIFRYRIFSSRPGDSFRFPTQALEPQLRKICDGEDLGQGEHHCRWEVSCDFTEVPAGEWRDIVIEGQSNGTFLKRGVNSTHMIVEFPTDISEANFWILMPRRPYRDWSVLRQTKGETGSVEAVKPATEFLADNQEIIGFKLLAVKPGYSYELSWNYR